ncbi:MAG TPA: helix-hairpin-helix domain-containing protein [Pseudacidobacterium sp.]|jgi:DNA uptake protein ComE-like DNA-binding protein|nr:helix-hairpin-helix domain-containing protein [Pseudacidobacterium sp.]
MKQASPHSKNNLRRWLVALAIGAALLSGCEKKHSDEELQQKAADATQRARQTAQQAADTARQAAANAERKVNAITAGVKQGLQSGNSPIDINSASEDQLAALPGMTRARARHIIHGRPYAAPHDLVDKGVLSQAQYDQISGQIAAN